MPPIHPDQFAETPAAVLLESVALGHLAVDHRVLHALLDNLERSLPSILEYAGRDRGEERVATWELLSEIFAVHPVPEAIPFLVDEIRQVPDDVPDIITEAVARQRGSIIDPLLQLHEELGFERGLEVRFLLAAVRPRDPRVLTLLLEELEREPSDGVFHLEVFGDPEARPRLEQLRAEHAEHPDFQRRIDFAIESLSENLGIDDLGPYDIYRYYPKLAEAELDEVPESERLPFLESPYAPHRLAAVGSFLHRPLSDARRQQMLKIAREDAEAVIRGRAWEALREEADKAPVLKAMLARLGEADVPPSERASLACALAYNGDEPGVKEAILAAYEEPGTRAKALEAMWRALDPDFIPYPQQHLDDKDPDVRREAITAVGYLGPANAATKLPAFFDDEELRAEALYAYALAAPGESTRVGVRQILSRIKELAGELDDEEETLVQRGLDMRLEMHGKPAVFFPEQAETPPPAPTAAKVGRNDPCPCGSGKKYKKCCGA